MYQNKNLCIKLVRKDYYYNRMHGQQNVKTMFDCRQMTIKISSLIA